MKEWKDERKGTMESKEWKDERFKGTVGGYEGKQGVER